MVSDGSVEIIGDEIGDLMAWFKLIETKLLSWKSEAGYIVNERVQIAAGLVLATLG